MPNTALDQALHAVCVTDFVTPDGKNKQRLHFTQTPTQVLRAYTAHEVLAALQTIEHATAQGQWAVGYVAYEAAAALDSKIAQAMCRAGEQGQCQHVPKSATPLLMFALFHAPDAEATYANGLPAQHPCSADATNDSVQKTSRKPNWCLSESRETYIQKIDTIRRAIAAGDVYQVNHTLRAHAQTGADFSPWYYYEALQQRQQGAYGAYLDFGDHQVLSLSPELFFDWNRSNNAIITRPMKGTAPRGSDAQTDLAQQQHLQSSSKERAENVMIVDLLRNDLGRIATTGSVHVPNLLQTEAYPTLWQMTSTVQATLQANTTLTQVLQALFPCGSITGAPKHMSMHKIAALEDEPRGVYCGAVGIINRKRAVFNVAIRTIYRIQYTGHMQCGIGGGITWPSVAQDEYDEALLKAQFLHTQSLPQADFALRETLLLAHGQYTLLPLHLQRISQSAKSCGFCPASQRQYTQALQNFAQQTDTLQTPFWRVALTQTADGKVSVQGVPLDGAFLEPSNPSHTHWLPDEQLPPNWLQAPAIDALVGFKAQPVVLAAHANTCDNNWLLHKTTNRAHYDAALAENPAAWEVILHNSQGFATEFTRGNLVLQTAQGCITPPLQHGLLPGTLREALLRQGTIREETITTQRLQQLQAGERLWFINSVRGWVPVVLLLN